MKDKLNGAEMTEFSEAANISACMLNMMAYQCLDLSEWHWNDLAEPHWRLYYAESEGAMIIYDGKQLPLLPTEITLIAPRTHYAARLLKPPVRKHFVHFTAGFPYDLHPPAIYQFAVPSDTVDVLCELCTAAEKSSIGEIYFLALTLVGRTLSLVPKNRWPALIIDPKIRKALGLIEQLSSTNLNNTILASRVGMSLSSFKQRFQELVGLPPQQLRRQFRMEKAVKLLTRTEESIEEIAEECGYSDRHTFSKAFKRRFQQSPGTFRRRIIVRW